MTQDLLDTCRLWIQEFQSSRQTRCRYELLERRGFVSIMLIDTDCSAEAQALSDFINAGKDVMSDVLPPFVGSRTWAVVVVPRSGA